MKKVENQNHTTSPFFKNPPDGAEHVQKCIESKHDSVSISNVECGAFHIETEPCLTETKCNSRTLGVDESFWAKQQSCIS